MNKDDQILKKLEHLDKRFDQSDEKFANIDKRFDQSDEKSDRLVNRVINHEDRLQNIETNMVTKQEFRDFKDENLTRQDEMVTILRHLDQERIFTQSWIKRLENQVKENTREIARTKKFLKIA